MKVALSNKVLGKSAFLVYDFDSKSYETTNKVTEDVWVVGDVCHPYSVEEYALSLGKSFEMTYPEKYVTMAQQLIGIDEVCSYPYFLMMSGEEVKKITLNTFDNTQKFFEKNMNGKYQTTYKKTQAVLKGLTRPRIDIDRYNHYLRNAIEGQRAILDKITYDREGFAQKIIYTRSDTTGRMKVFNGPNVLSLKKEYRDVFCSRYKNGKIVQVDFVSHEPRTLSSISNLNMPYDIHGYIANELLEGKISRSDVKAIVMGMLYGMSLNALRSRLSSDQNAKEVMRKIKSYFKLLELENRLKLEMKDARTLNNYYGRAIKYQENDSFHLISHYIQSTAVDVALLGFRQIFDKIAESGFKISPFMLIHDAMYLDVSGDIEDSQLEDVLKSAEVIPGFNNKFYVSIEEL
jgi:hypothetical protein